MKRLFFIPLCLLFWSCGPQSASELADSGDPSFSVVTYNVQSRPLLDASKASKNLPMIGQRLNDFDIVGVQECFNLCNLLLDKSQHKTKHYFSEREHWWSLANSGLASMGRWPVSEIKTRFFQNKTEIADLVASKGILLMRYQIDGATLDVYNTHMQAGNSPEAQEARRKQAQELIRFVREHSPDDHAVVVHGDFNMSPQRPGKDWKGQFGHFADEGDMLARTAVFSGILRDLHLQDASDEVQGPKSEYIDRFIYRSGRQLSIKPLTWEDRDPAFRDDSGHRLSDSSPVVVRFSRTR